MIGHDLIEQVGGIERARGIVDGAPDNSEFWRDMDSVCSPNEILYYAWFGGALLVFDSDKGWIKSIYHDDNEYILDQLQDLNDLRTAIAEHDNLQPCIGCGSSDLHKGGEIKEPKMCFKCYAAMTGFTLIGDQLLEDDELAEIKAGHRIDKRLESDDCTDIRNHLSPSTKVVDL